MITAYMQGCCLEKALSLFSDMNRSVVYASEVTFASVLGSYGAVLAHCLSRLVHGLLVKYGFVANVILESSIVDVYEKCQVIKCLMQCDLSECNVGRVYLFPAMGRGSRLHIFYAQYN